VQEAAVKCCERSVHSSGTTENNAL